MACLLSVGLHSQFCGMLKLTETTVHLVLCFSTGVRTAEPNGSASGIQGLAGPPLASEKNKLCLKSSATRLLEYGLRVY